MSKQAYVLVKQVHFGNFKTSFSIGTIFDYVEDGDKRFVIINGEKHENTKDIDIAIREKFVIPYVKGKTKVDTTIKTMPSLKEKKELKIDKSDMDQMKEVIDISYTKNDVRKAKRDADRAKSETDSAAEKKDAKFIRGLEVISNDPRRETSISLKNNDSKIVKKLTADKKPIQIDNDRQVLAILNETDKTAKEKHNTLASLTVKKGDDKAMKLAEKRAADRKAQANKIKVKTESVEAIMPKVKHTEKSKVIEEVTK